MSFEKWFQSRLTSHGFAVGGIDGIIGKTTIAATKAFQRRNKIPVTGRSDVATVEALRKTSRGDVDFERDEAPSINHNGSEVFPLQRDVTAFYGKVGTNQTRITPPWKMKLSWDRRRYIKQMTLHEKCAESALRAMRRVYAYYGQAGIEHLGLDQFGGSLNVRRMRGGRRYSMHSWGIAIDFDPVRNALRTKAPKARLSHDDCVPFWEAWEDEGWISLGRERNFDWMHVQAARI